MLSNYHHNFHLLPTRFTGVNAIYLNTVLRTLGVSLFGIYLPIFVFKLGGVDLVFIYFIIWRLLELAALPLLAIVIVRISYRKAMALSNLLLVLALLFLIFSQTNRIFLWLSLPLLAALVVLYWLPFHTVFVLDQGDDRLLPEISWRFVLDKLSGAAGPLFGGLIITSLGGFRLLYSLAIAIILVSSAPLFFMPGHQREFSFDFKQVYTKIFAKNFRNFLLSFSGAGFENTAMAVLLPIFIFLSFGSYRTVGLLLSAGLLFSAVSVYVLNKKPTAIKKLFKGGLSFNLLNWPVKALGATTTSLLFLNIFYDLASIFIWLPFVNWYYQEARTGKRALEFFVKRETALNLARVTALSLAWGLITIEAPWWAVFSLTGSLGLLLISRAKI